MLIIEFESYLCKGSLQSHRNWVDHVLREYRNEKRGLRPMSWKNFRISKWVQEENLAKKYHKKVQGMRQEDNQLPAFSLKQGEYFIHPSFSSLWASTQISAPSMGMFFCMMPFLMNPFNSHALLWLVYDCVTRTTINVCHLLNYT